MIPLRDDNPTILWPAVTIAFIAANFAVFLYQLSLYSIDPGLEHAFVYQLGMVPAAITRRSIAGGGYYTVMTAMFLHGGWMHLIGNMLYLWIFGNNIEDSMGHPRFIIFYLVAGIAAAFSHLAFNAASTVPTIGASGAVSGVLGAYLVLYPHARVQTLIFFGWFFRVIYLPAWLLLVFWIGLQIISQAAEPLDPNAGGVAYAAHIGGFFTGVVLVPLFRKNRRRTHFRYY